MSPSGAWMSWSSGKDSAFALHTARRNGSVEVVGLLTTLNGDAHRVAMHAVRRELLDAQADRLGLPLHPVELPSPCPNELYEARMTTALTAASADGVEQVLFGDLHLADVRAYRERTMAGTGVAPRFPLWGLPTDELARAIIDAGIRAVLTCVDPARLPATFVGRAFDERLLADLPQAVDPCGEQGEFHTFVWDGPSFRSPIGIEIGEVVARDGFVFCDVLPTG